MENQKKALWEACANIIQEKLDALKSRKQLLEASRNNETKSTAGDKYETGRAMMQIEIDQCQTQLLKAESEWNMLHHIGYAPSKLVVSEGSLVETNRGSYFIAVGLGKVKIEAGLFFCISKEAPIARRLLGKKVAESFTFNESEIKILKIY